MRGTMLCMAVLAQVPVCAQNGWLPLSREAERPFATPLHQHGSDAHTAIRPYRMRDVERIARTAGTSLDSLRGRAALPVLDRWAGARNGRRFRWGPLLDASMAADAGVPDALRHRAGAGLWSDLDAGERLNFHVDVQGWHERFPSYLDTVVRATQVSPGEGYADGDSTGYRHWDWNGHVSWDAGKYFNLTLGKGRNAFGEGVRSMMLSDEAYGYPFLRITTTVWHIRYVNLFTRMNDIRFAGGDPTRYHGKYTSMHYLSWNASKRINVAVFEAIVWQQGDSAYPRGFDPNYLNPIILYRPVEYDIGSPDNALLGFGLNVKAGRNTLFYTQFVLDEFLLREVRAGNGWYGNKQSVQAGVVARDAFRSPGLCLRAEWNFVRPFMYTHSDTRQNYAHHGQPLAHPYGSNLQELLAMATRDRGRWTLALRTSMAWMGSDSVDSYGNNIFRPERERPRRADNPALPRNNGYRVGERDPIALLHAEVRTGFLLDPHTATRLEASYLFRARNAPRVPNEVSHVFRLGLVCHFRERHPEQERRYVLP